MALIIGETYGRWKVISRSDQRDTDGKFGLYNLVCQCERGTERVVHGRSVKAGHSKSCGCLRNETTGNRSRTHGMTKHPAYKSWQHARERCRNSKHKNYDRYGGRGITFSEVWDDFRVFWEEMGETWAEGLSIDRIDNDGNYEPGNCKWSDMREQCNNRYNNVIIPTPHGPMTVQSAAREFGVHRSAIFARIERGWDYSDLLMPSLKRHPSMPT